MAGQSARKPARSPILASSAAMLDRQSTSVPKTSKAMTSNSTWPPESLLGLYADNQIMPRLGASADHQPSHHEIEIPVNWRRRHWLQEHQAEAAGDHQAADRRESPVEDGLIGPQLGLLIGSVLH